MIHSVNQVLDHLLHTLPSPLNIPTLEDCPWKDLDKPLILRELMLRQLAHLLGIQTDVSTINFNMSLTHSFQPRLLHRVLLRMFPDHCEW